MGIRGLNSYICKNIPTSFREINILNEIDDYKRRGNKNPTIIINLWTMLNHFEMSSNIEDDLFGKRLNLMKEKFEMFLDLMVKQGAILIFAFKKNRFRELDFLISEENDYKKSKMFLHNLKTLNTIEVVDNFKKHRNRKLSCMEIVSIALVQSAQKFGKLCGVMDSSIKHSTFVTELATNEDAMAIMGTDSNYFFYNGNWTIWSDMTLDMKKMKIMQFDKKTVLTHLGLKSEEKQLFVALAGGLYSSIENVKEIGKYFCQYQNNIDKFKMIVKFVQTYESPPNEKTLGNIVKKIFKQNIPQLVEDFRETLASFESNHYFVDSEKTNIMEKFKDEYLCYGQEILRDCKLYISSVYLDLNVDKGLLKKLVLPWIEKTVEALLKNEDDPKTISLMMKDFDQVQISEHEIKVGISEFPIPQQEILVFGLMNDTYKMKLFNWITGTAINSKIPQKYLTNIIILLHLIKFKAIMFFEASCILQTIVDVDNKSETLKIDEYPVKIDEKAYRASVLYQKLYSVLCSCLSCVGLKNLVTDVNFDSVRYQVIYSVMKRIDHGYPENETEMIKKFMSIINND